MKAYIMIEGYGVSGPANEVRLTTTTLYSCSAIVMHNRDKAMPGLFHYGAKSLKGKDVMLTITNMHNDLQPNHIVLWPAKSSNVGSLEGVTKLRESVRLDNEYLQEFLVSTKGSNRTFARHVGKQPFPGVQVQNGELLFEGFTTNIEIPGKLGFSPGRTQSGNINYYYAPGTGGNEYGKDIDKIVDGIIEKMMDSMM